MRNLGHFDIFTSYEARRRFDEAQHQPLPGEDSFFYEAYNCLEDIQDTVWSSVIPRLDQPEHLEHASWDRSGFMSYWLGSDLFYGLYGRSFSLHIWPKGLRKRQLIGLGPLDDMIWDGDIRSKNSHQALYMLTGYENARYGIEEVLLSQGDEKAIATDGLFRVFLESYDDLTRTRKLVAGEEKFRVTEKGSSLIAGTNIHKLQAHDFYAPKIPEDRLAAALVCTSPHPEGIGPSETLIRDPEIQEVSSSHRGVTFEEAVQAKDQLLGFISAQDSSPLQERRAGAPLSFRELEPAIQEELLLAQKTALESAYPRDKATKVGCVLVANGVNYTGANIKRWSWNDTTCAERMAVDTALAKGIDRIDRVIVYGISASGAIDGSIAPCGPCREILRETITNFKQRDVEVIMSNGNKTQIVRALLSELLPFSDALRSSE